MPDVKISLLDPASTPIPTTDSIAVVQSATTKKAALSTLLVDPVHIATDRTDMVQPPSTGVSVYALSKATRRRPAWVGSGGVDVSMQAHLASNKISLWSASGNSTTEYGATAPGIFMLNHGFLTSGAYNIRNVATTNLFTSTRRFGFNATTGVEGGLWGGAASFSRRHGFEYIVRFGCSVTGSTSFRTIGCGMVGATTSAAAFPTNGIWGQSSTAIMGLRLQVSNSFFYTADGAGGENVGSALSGTEFPGLTSANLHLYEVRVFCKPNDTVVYFRIENLTTGASFETSSSTGLPGLDVVLSPLISTAFTSGTGVTAVDVVSQYVETDF